MAPTRPWTSRIGAVTRRKAETASSYDRISRSYDTIVGRFERRYREKGVALLDVRKGERVLELGFGTGHALVDIAERVGNAGHVRGIDLSPAMREIALVRAERAGVHERVELTVGDAARLPYPDGCVDAAFASFTLELFATEEIPLVLSGCRRALVERGRLGLVALALDDEPRLGTRLYLLAHALFPGIVDCRPLPVPEILDETGFAIERRARDSMWGLPVEHVVARKI